MIEALASILSALRQTTPAILLGITIATGILLFSPSGFVDTLGMAEFRNSNRSWIGLAFLVSLSILLGQLAFYIAGVANSLREEKQEKERRKQSLRQKQQQLHNLSADEKAYLAPFILDDESTQYFLIEDGVAGGLTAKGVIYRSSQVGSLVDGWAFNIQPWAKEYLAQNPELLAGANPNPQGPPR